MRPFRITVQHSIKLSNLNCATAAVACVHRHNCQHLHHATWTICCLSSIQRLVPEVGKLISTMDEKKHHRVVTIQNPQRLPTAVHHHQCNSRLQALPKNSTPRNDNHSSSSNNHHINNGGKRNAPNQPVEQDNEPVQQCNFFDPGRFCVTMFLPLFIVHVPKRLHHPIEHNVGPSVLPPPGVATNKEPAEEVPCWNTMMVDKTLSS